MDKTRKAALAGFLLSIGLNANAGVILSDDFDPITASNWTLSGAGVDGSPAGEYYDGNALRFFGSGTRSATTIALDLSSGGDISFRLKIGGPRDTSEFEDADNGEDVVLEYSVNNGSLWSNLFTFDTENTTYRDTWGLFSTSLGSLGANTLFRWRQVNHSGSSWDHWAIDDVSIASASIVSDAVPAPTALSLLAGGLIGLGGLRRRWS